MNKQELGKIIAKDAPILGSLVGSVSPIAGSIIIMLSHLFNANSHDLEDLSNKIQTDPGASEKLKEIEIQGNIQEYQAMMNDKADARARDLKIIQAGKEDWILSLLAIIFIVSFFGICVLNYFFPLKDDHVMIMLIGQISAGVGMILSFYFGASIK